jgi:hypothetical protein
MNTPTCAALEWEPLLALVAGFAASPVGRQAILDLRPSTDEDWITRQHQLTANCAWCWPSRFPSPAADSSTPRNWPPRRRFRRGARSAELQAVARLANDVAAWQALLQSPPARLAGKLPGLSELSAALTTSLRPLAEAIERTIQPDGSLADNASPELNRIRREQERQQRVIEESCAPRCASSPPTARRRKTSSPSAATASSFPSARAQAAHLRRGPRRQLFGTDGLRGAARNHRAEQRAGAPDRRRAGRDSSHLCALTRQVGGYAPGWSKARACWRWSTACRPAPVSPATTTALPRHYAGSAESRSRPPSAAGKAPARNRAPPNTAVRSCSAHARAHGGASPAHHQRAQHRRQDRHAQDHGAAGHDGPGRPARPRTAASFPVFTPSSPTSATRNPSRPRSPLSPRTSPTSTGCRGWPARIRWCCSTSSARPPIPKKARRWPWPLPATSSKPWARGRSSPRTTPRSRSTPPTLPACSMPRPAWTK